MSSGLLDDQSIDLPCPTCGHKTAKTIRWVKANTHLTCRCGQRIRLDSAEFKREIAAIERQLNNLFR